MLFSRVNIAALSDIQKKEILFGGAFGQLPPPCHAALVLGGCIEDMRSRAASAVKLCGLVPVRKVIACGGAEREDEGRVRAECDILCDLLRAGGVGNIVAERCSKDTIENVLFAFTLLKNDLLTHKKFNVVIISSPWHLCRAVALARRLMPKTVKVYGYHAEFAQCARAWDTSPALRERADGELLWLKEAVLCGFADDFKI